MYVQIPTRTTADPNAFADINQLQDNFDALLDGSKEFDSITFNDTTGTTGIHTESGILKYKGATIATGAGGATHRILPSPAGSWFYPTANPAELNLDTGTNGGEYEHLFDDTTEEFLLNKAEVPYDFDPTGRVIFKAVGKSIAGAANQSVQFKFYHSARTKGEDWDNPYGSIASGDVPVSATAGIYNYATWSTLGSALGWNTGDEMRTKLSRITVNSGTTVSGDYGFTDLILRTPRV